MKSASAMLVNQEVEKRSPFVCYPMKSASALLVNQEVEKRSHLNLLLNEKCDRYAC
ncbi:hypothetical protein [Floridanema aerugineum]|uniref:Uncharacterized protein n=1 Tax=Floridaenema aerugineum BLCC-F46 TaxID=3153654 RepID=A0ABV4X2V8_9CYAN